MTKEEIKKDLDAIWSQYQIEPGDSESEVVKKFSQAFKRQMDYFND